MSATTATQHRSLFPTHLAALAFLLLTSSSLVSSGPSSQSDQHRLRFIEEPESRFTGIDGKKITFKCSASPKEADIKWLRNGNIIEEKQFEWITIGKNKLTVKVENHFPTTDGHDGHNNEELYQCLAELKGQVMLSQPAKLILAELAAFTPQDNVTINVIAGNTAVIPCELPKGFPYVFSEFQYKNISISRSRDHYRLVPSGALQIFTAKPQDSGTYRCIAHNPFLNETVIPNHFVTLKVIKQKHATGRLAALKDLHFAVTPNVTTMSVLGQNITIECVANGHPVPRIKWFKRESNGREGELPQGRAYQESGNLHITTLEKGDEGDYVCQAIIQKTKKSIEFVTTLEIHEMPQILNSKNDEDNYEVFDVNEGRDLELSCETRGNPHIHITWLHNGYVIESKEFSKGYEISADEKTLKIIRSSRDHAGIYQCFATNTLGSTYSTKLVNVRSINDMSSRKEKGQNNRKENSHRGGNNNGDNNHRNSGHGNRGNSFDNGVSGRPSTSSTSGYEHPEDKHIPHPVVEDVIGNEDEDDEDFGEGAVSERPKKNRKQKGENFAKIKPTRPIVSRLNDKSVMLRWSLEKNDSKNPQNPSQSPFNHSLPITFFKIQYKEQTRGSEWQTLDEEIPPHIFTYAVSGLDPQPSYRFRVSAAYQDDDSRQSPSSAKFNFPKDSVNKQPVNSPTIVAGKALSPTEISISWEFINIGDIPIDGFFIYYQAAASAGSPSKVTAMGSSLKKKTVGHLEPGVIYEFRMKTFNFAGTSEFSNTYQARTENGPQTSTEKPDTPYDPIGDNNIDSPPSSGSGNTRDGAGNGRGDAGDNFVTQLHIPKEILMWFNQSNQWQLLVVFIVFVALILVFLACCLSFIIRTKSGSKKMKKVQGNHSSKTPPTLPGDFYFNNSNVSSSAAGTGFERARAQSSHHLAQSTTSLSRSAYKAPSMMHPSLADMVNEQRAMPEMRPLNGHSSMMRLPRQHDIDTMDGQMSTLNRKNTFRKSMSISAHHLAYQHQHLIQKNTYDYQQDSAGHSGSHPSASDSDDGSLSNSNQNHHLSHHHLSHHHLHQGHQAHLPVGHPGHLQGGHQSHQAPPPAHYMSTMERKRASMQRLQESYNIPDSGNSYTLSKMTRHSATRHNGTLERKRRSRGDLSTIDRAYLRNNQDYGQNPNQNPGQQNPYLQNNLQNQSPIVIMQSSC